MTLSISPSSSIPILFRSSISSSSSSSSSRICSRHTLPTLPLPQPRHISFLANPNRSLSSPHQFYISASTDPFLNLSLEHYLLRHTPPHSAILLLYINRPCVVIGRNQNPWVEVNFPRCRNWGGEGMAVEFLRRRSGGGAVFHDEGNLNFSVISPKAEFTRNKHAEMVVRALKRCAGTFDGDVRVRVNERHDIVLDVPDSSSPDASTSTKQTLQTLKISGSAYRLTGSRALHHGTCLVASPNLGGISGILRASAREWIKAKGVESVRSMVGNVSSYMPEAERRGLMGRIQQRILEEFRVEYGLPRAAGEGDGYRRVEEEECLEIDDIRKGIEELKSTAWRYNQTPQFTFSTHTSSDDPRQRPPLPPGIPPSTHISMTIKSGAVQSAQISTSSDPVIAQRQTETIASALVGRAVCEVGDWRDVLVLSGAFDGVEEEGEGERVGEWLNELLACV